MSRDASVHLAVGNLVGRDGKTYRTNVPPSIRMIWDNETESLMDSALGPRILNLLRDLADPSADDW